MSDSHPQEQIQATEMSLPSVSDRNIDEYDDFSDQEGSPYNVSYLKNKIQTKKKGRKNLFKQKRSLTVEKAFLFILIGILICLLIYIFSTPATSPSQAAPGNGNINNNRDQRTPSYNPQQIPNRIPNQQRQVPSAPVQKIIVNPPKPGEQTWLNQNLHKFDCTPYDPIYHYFSDEKDKLYYGTRHNVFVPMCQPNWVRNIGREIIETWDKEREIIEWARVNVRRGDNILYDANYDKNLQILIILSRFVGEGGSLAVTFKKETCITDAFDLNKIKNMKTISSTNRKYEDFDVVISLQQAFFRKSIKGGLVDKMPKKLLVKLRQAGQGDADLSGIKKNTNLNMNKILFDNSDCKAKINLSEASTGAGYYQVIRKDYRNTPETEMINQIENPMLTLLKRQFKNYIESIPQPSEKKDINNITGGYPVQMSQLSASNEEKGRWEKEKEVVEWVKNRTKEDSQIFYELKYIDINLFSLLNVAKLVPKGKVVVSCSDKSWKKVEEHSKKLKINNIHPLKHYPDIIKSQKILAITDNIKTISSIAHQNTIGERLLLAFIIPEQKEMIELLYTLYVKTRIRKVGIFPSFYFGYEIFDHFLWYSEKPSDFFQIEKKRYTVHQIWSQNISDMTQNRKFCLRESFRHNTPEIKVINPYVGPYFEDPEHPFHEGFKYLSPVHRADYLRSYLCHYYGGGYSDIKHIHFDFQPYFEELYNGPEDKYAVGYPQKYALYPSCVSETGGVSCAAMKKNHSKYMGADTFIHKRQSPITTEWFGRITKTLDQKLEALKKNPAQVPRDYLGSNIRVNGTYQRSKYPLTWEGINAQPHARAQNKYFGQYYLNLPYVNIFDYQ